MPTRFEATIRDPDHRHCGPCCAIVEPEEDYTPEPVEVLELLSTPDLSATQERVRTVADALGMRTKVSGSRIRIPDEPFITGGRPDLKKGIKIPSHEIDCVFMLGRLADTPLAFQVMWEGSKFFATVSDPFGEAYFPLVEHDDAGQFVRYNTVGGWVRNTWVIKSSKEFEAWLDKWRGLILGETKAEEKERKAREVLARKTERQQKIYDEYMRVQELYDATFA